MTDSPTRQVVYCGCWQESGHMTFGVGMKRLTEHGAGPWKDLDSKSLNPGGRHGRALVTHEGGWTALGITDYSVDTRLGSHATFAIPGEHSFDDAYAVAAAMFPEVIKRIEAAGAVTHCG